jgi:hypothetical protein
MNKSLVSAIENIMLCGDAMEIFTSGNIMGSAIFNADFQQQRLWNPVTRQRALLQKGRKRKEEKTYSRTTCDQ